MNSILYTIIMSGLWILNLFNGSGLGQAYRTTEKARIVILIVFIVVIIIRCKERHFLMYRRNLFMFSGMAIIFSTVPLLKGYGNMGFHYLFAFMLVYILSRIGVKDLAIRLTGIIYMIMGMGVLYIYDYGSTLSGWNGNTIGMIGLYSFLIFLISFYNVKDTKIKVAIIAITIIYIRLIGPTDSRSSVVFASMAVLFALSILPRKFIMKTDKRYYWWLLLPLFVAIIVIIVSYGSYMKTLDLWSLRNFQKPIFNGRDELWEKGLKILRVNPLLGGGTLMGNWHNCVITVLVAYGCMGCIFWILSLQNILSKGRKWIDDVVISGSIITFIMMYIQQSVELGLVHENPNLLPYIVLGIMLGRVKFLDKYKNVGRAE